MPFISSSRSAVTQTDARLHPLYLAEVSKRDKSWDKFKLQSFEIARLYKQIGYDNYASRILSCAPILGFNWKVDPHTGLALLRLHSARFCRVRHCPICQSRRSAMWIARILKALPSLQEAYPTARFIFLTLTVRNCPVGELRETIAHMNRSWQRLSQRRKFPAIGFIKALEVTRSGIGEAHPHFHVLLLVKASYFSHAYLTHADWVTLWRDALRADYDPSVRVKAVTKSRIQRPGPIGDLAEKNPLAKAVLETLKYSVKPEDLITEPEWLGEITRQLQNLKSVSVGGVLKEHISEEEPEDLIGSDESEDESEKTSDIAFGFSERMKHYTSID